MMWLRRFFSRKNWAVIVDRYEDEGGGTVAVLNCGHEICIDYRTPRFECPICLREKP